MFPREAPPPKLPYPHCTATQAAAWFTANGVDRPPRQYGAFLFPITAKDPTAAARSAGTLVLLGREDLTLKDRLKAELSGVLNWALEGLDRLRERGTFTMSESSREMLTALLEASSPTRTFFEEHYVLDPTSKVPKAVVFRQWTRWAGTHGHMSGEELVA